MRKVVNTVNVFAVRNQRTGAKAGEQVSRYELVDMGKSFAVFVTLFGNSPSARFVARDLTQTEAYSVMRLRLTNVYPSPADFRFEHS